MKRSLLVAAAALALGACTFPQTKMQPVGETQMQQQQQQPPAPAESTSEPASAKSAAATR